MANTGVSLVFASLAFIAPSVASARQKFDLEAWLDRLVPEDDPHFTHTLEGADDMPSHIKMALTRTSEVVACGVFRDTRPLMSKVLSLLSTLQPGIFTVVSA